MKLRNLVLSGTTLLTLLCVFPIVLLVMKSFQVGTGWGLDHYRHMLADSTNMAALWRTVRIALMATGGALVLALPFAFLIARTDLPAKGLVRTLFMVPYMVPPFVGAIAWTYLGSPKIGYLNRIGAAPWLNIYSVGGLVWVLAIFFLPRIFLAVTRAFEQLNPALEEAAYMAGAGHIRVARTVTLPLILPSILGGAFLVFIAAAESFGVPAIIGMPAKLTVIPTRIMQAIYVGSPEAIRTGSAMASLLMGLALVALAGSNLRLARTDFATVGGKSQRIQPIGLGRWRYPVLTVSLIIGGVISVLPLAAILATTFVRSVGLDLFDPGNWTVNNWTLVLTSTKTWKTLRFSLFASASAATVSVLVGAVIAYMRVRVPGRFSRWPDQLSALGSATPGTVIAIGLILAYSGRYGLNLYGTVAIIVLAYMVRNLVTAVRTLAAALQQLHPVLEEAALVSGAGWLRAMRDVVVPLLAPSLASAWFLVFTPSLYELPMSVLLYSAHTQTIGVYLYDMQSYADPQAAAVLSVVLVSLVLAGNAVLRKVTRGTFGV